MAGAQSAAARRRRRHRRDAAACSAPSTIDFEGLQQPDIPSASSPSTSSSYLSHPRVPRKHRHQCHVLRKICLFNGTLVPHGPGPDADNARRVAESLTVRSQFGSHQTFKLAYLHPMNVPRPESLAAQLLRMFAPHDGDAGGGLSACVPLAWVPVWAFSFADSVVSSLLPVEELLHAKLIDEAVLLRPDLWAWPRSKNPVYRMMQHLSDAPMRSLRESAPLCRDDAARLALQGARGTAHCRPQCYERTVVCQFRSTFDAYEPPMAPWRAAQRVAKSVLRTRSVGADAAGERTALEGRADRADGRQTLHVVFVNRTRTKFSRSLANLPRLLEQCAAARLRRAWPDGWSVRCTAHEFGAARLSADVRAAQSADVLVGTHGAGLINAFFMRRGGALVEVRPYGFEGEWPDKYFKALTSLEQAVLYLQVSAGSPALSVPRPPANVSVWDARDHAVRLPWRTLSEVLRAAMWINGSKERYVERLWKQGAVFVSRP